MDSISTLFLAGALFIVMLGMGLSLILEDFRRIIYYPKAIFVGLFNQLVLLPIIGFGLTFLFPMQPEIAIGIMILTACPGGPTSNLISFLAKADLALSVSLTAISSLITIITIPFIVNFALSYFLEAEQMIELNTLQTIAQIFIIVVIPIAIGMLIRHYKTSFAERMGKFVKIASAVVLVLIIVGIVIKERENIIPYFQQAGLSTITLNVLTMTIGYYSAKLMVIENKQALSIAIETGIQNGTLAITIAIVLLGNTAFAVAPAVYSLLMFITGGLLIYWSNHFSMK